MPDRLRRALPFAIPLAGWLWLAVYAWPGIVTWDGVLQLGEARSGVYSDDHPALYIAIWHAVDAVVPGPAGMFVLQSTLLLVGLVAWMRRVFVDRPIAASIAATAIFVFPPVMAPMSAVWKDSLMAALLVAGTAALFAAPASRDPVRARRILRALGIVALFVATAVRYNAAAATLAPLVVVDWGWAGRRFARYAIGAAVWLAVTLAAFATNAVLTDKPMHSWQTTVAVFDIVGVIARTDEPLTDAELQRILDGSDLRVTHDIQAAARDIYSPRDYFRAIAEDDRAFWRVPWYDAPPERQCDALARAWWELVTAHPWAYVGHRTAVFRELLRDNGAAVPWRGTLTGAQPERRALDLEVTARGYQAALMKALQRLERATPLFAPWLYAALALALAPFALRHRDLGALIASAILYEGTLWLLASSLDYRYSHWLIIAAIVCAVGLTARRLRAKVPAVQEPAA